MDPLKLHGDNGKKNDFKLIKLICISVLFTFSWETYLHTKLLRSPEKLCVHLQKFSVPQRNFTFADKECKKIYIYKVFGGTLMNTLIFSSVVFK